jgi:hypothetical protein
MSNLIPIIPIVRREPFDDPAWLFDLKLDGFRSPTPWPAACCRRTPAKAI